MDLADIKDLETFNRWLAEHSLTSYWAREGEPASDFKPHLWKWADIYEGLMRAGRLVSMDQTGELSGQLAGRKNIALKVPSLRAGVTKTINLGVQILMPGEIAEAHRHTQAGLRFVIKAGPGAAMVVEGEAMPMEEGDLITTPAWAWHDYYNQGSEPAIWLDGLDIPIGRLGHMFREIYPSPQQPVEKPVGFSAKTLGPAKPTWIEQELPTPPFRYRWVDTYATLTALKEREVEPDPCNGFHLMYTHPLTGGATVPTMAGGVHLFPAHFKAQAHRQNCTTFYHVFRGQGATTIGDQRFEWTQGDVFVIPPWKWHSHENRLAEDAILFSVTDQPTMAALRLYREERVDT